MSAATKNQVISFILSTAVCFLLILAGFEPVQGAFRGWAPEWLADAVASLSFLTHFDSITKGKLQLPDLVFFLSLIAGWIAASGVVLELKKAE